MLEIVALICARNEATALSMAIPHLEREGVGVVLMDNGSDDGTRDIFTSQRFSNIVRVVDVPYAGCFDLSLQLAEKQRLIDTIHADWVIHQDADEILQGPDRHTSLRQEIGAAHASGFNVLNFNELVMLPADPAVDDVPTNNTNYYFYEPRPLQLMRAWRRSDALRMDAHGGHLLSGGDLRISPRRMLLKHFMVRSQEHAYAKYLQRVYANGDIARGWHRRRTLLTREQLVVPTRSSFLHHLADPWETPRLPTPVRTHFWDWR